MRTLSRYLLYRINSLKMPTATCLTSYVHHLPLCIAAPATVDASYIDVIYFATASSESAKLGG